MRHGSLLLTEKGDHKNFAEIRWWMRRYFFWDEDTNQVVVGWLPSHLSNRIS